MKLSPRAIEKALSKLPRVRPVLRLAAVTAALVMAPASAQAPLDVRVALIIGNSAYATSPLLNPANDARAMGEVLRSLGFQVIELRDGSKSQMTEAITRVSASLKGKQGVGMLYYAGHGLQLDWRNYMVPVDANLKNASDVAAQTIDLSSVIDTFKAAGNRMNIVVLDACRDNPFGSSTSSGKGLAQLDAPPGTFLAYATAPGNVAEDGDEKSGNGLYTLYLLQELKKPIAKIEDVFKRVRLNVRKQSQGRQIPWESTSLEDDFYFNDGVKFTIKPEELARIAAEARASEQKRLAQEAQAKEREQQLALQVSKERERQQTEALALEQQRVAAETRAREAARLGAEARGKEQEKLAAEAREREQQRLAQEAQARERERLLAQEQAKERERLASEARAREQERLAEATRLKELERLAAQAKAPPPPASSKADKELLAAQAFKEEKAAWDAIRTSNNADDFYAFLQRYPSGGELAELAQYRLDQLAKPKIKAALGKGQDASLGYAGARYKVGDLYQVQMSDVLTNVPGERYTERVTAIDGDTVQINNGNAIRTVLGAAIKNPRGTYDPPFGGTPVEFQVGKKWSSRSIQQGIDGNPYQLQMDAKVVGRETITVPAGTFQTYVLETVVYVSNGSVNRTKFWVDPRYGNAIRSEEIARNRFGHIFRSDRRELVAINAVRD